MHFTSTPTPDLQLINNNFTEFNLNTVILRTVQILCNVSLPNKQNDLPHTQAVTTSEFAKVLGTGLFCLCEYVSFNALIGHCSHD